MVISRTTLSDVTFSFVIYWERCELRELDCGDFFAAMPLSGYAQTASVLPQPASAEALPLHPWQAPVRNTTNDAYFANLEDGAKIETPFRVEFGLGGG